MRSIKVHIPSRSFVSDWIKRNVNICRVDVRNVTVYALLFMWLSAKDVAALWKDVYAFYFYLWRGGGMCFTGSAWFGLAGTTCDGVHVPATGQRTGRGWEDTEARWCSGLPPWATHTHTHERECVCVRFTGEHQKKNSRWPGRHQDSPLWSVFPLHFENLLNTWGIFQKDISKLNCSEIFCFCDLNINRVIFFVWCHLKGKFELKFDLKIRPGEFVTDCVSFSMISSYLTGWVENVVPQATGVALVRKQIGRGGGVVSVGQVFSPKLLKGTFFFSWWWGVSRWAAFVLVPHWTPSSFLYSRKNIFFVSTFSYIFYDLLLGGIFWGCLLSNRILWISGWTFHRTCFFCFFHI